MFSSTKTATSTSNFSERLADLRRLIAEADYVLIGAGAGLTTAAGIDYAGEDFRTEFREWMAQGSILFRPMRNAGHIGRCIYGLAVTAQGHCRYTRTC